MTERAFSDQGDKARGELAPLLVDGKPWTGGLGRPEPETAGLSRPEPDTVRGPLTVVSAGQGPSYTWWQVKDSNLRSFRDGFTVRSHWPLGQPAVVRMEG